MSQRRASSRNKQEKPKNDTGSETERNVPVVWTPASAPKTRRTVRSGWKPTGPIQEKRTASTSASSQGDDADSVARLEDVEGDASSSGMFGLSARSFDSLRSDTTRPTSAASTATRSSVSTLDSDTSATTATSHNDEVSIDSAFESPAFLRRARRPEVPVVTSFAPVTHKQSGIFAPRYRRQVSPMSKSAATTRTRQPRLEMRRRSRSVGNDDSIVEFLESEFRKLNERYSEARPAAPAPQ